MLDSHEYRIVNILNKTPGFFFFLLTDAEALVVQVAPRFLDLTRRRNQFEVNRNVHG